MKALRKYKYVKLQRNRIPKGKGIMGSWMYDDVNEAKGVSILAYRPARDSEED